jgi:hypothetical protein
MTLISDADKCKAHLALLLLLLLALLPLAMLLLAWMLRQCPKMMILPSSPLSNRNEERRS